MYYEDTDAGGVVYYANYLKYLERARTEFLKDHGIDVVRYHNEGYFFVVIHVDINYKRPTRLGDIIEVTTEVIEITNVTINLKHGVIKDSTILAEANVKVACINRDGRPQRIPESFKVLS
ncbi:MAG: YbgC/FadM family acyl-CoA thioesterase [Nitrospirota bacterium]